MSSRAHLFAAFASRLRPLATQMLQPAGNQPTDRLQRLLAAKTPSELSVHELREEVEGYLWALSPGAFRYFLPAFLNASLESYTSISVFVSELVGALTEPARADVEEALDRVAQIPPGLRLPNEMIEPLREQQLQWIDSGAPLAIFHERFDSLTDAEGAAVLAFFVALDGAHGADFPFNELQLAVERYWRRYRASSG